MQSVSSRLDSVQDAILNCLDLSADVMDILARLDGDGDELLDAKCKAFLRNVKDSQARPARARAASSPPLPASLQHGSTVCPAPVRGSALA